MIVVFEGAAVIWAAAPMNVRWRANKPAGEISTACWASMYVAKRRDLTLTYALRDAKPLVAGIPHIAESV
jgi:hypothetical protein